MKKFISILLLVSLFSSFVKAQSNETTIEQQRNAAMGVISRFIGEESGLSVNITLDLQKNSKGCDKYSYSYSAGILEIHASSAVAACRSFYDFVKSNGAGIDTWSAKRFEMPATITSSSKSVTSPYRDHQYLNVVTYGYSMPYWDAERWDKELDWMALHGIDMPLMLLASEAIYRKVFAEKGVTEAQLDEWEVGPAHLPWMRMGNLSGNSFDGPLGKPWHESQIALAHHVLAKMKELGMKPVVPAFGGFVPKAYAQKLGSSKYVATGWNWVPQSYRNYRITPAVPEFKEIGKRFIELWDAEFEPTFGEFKYYLSDSFNEMDVPNDLSLLRTYGKNIYDAIIEGSNNPEAVWVTQGWEFVYGRGKWSSDKYKALRQDCAPHQFMSLYMAPEYGGYQWDYYNNFHGDDWNYTMLPNMGGKNFWTGRLQNYASDYPKNLANGGAYSNCTGWGMTMEGIEYNELLFELITDMGWTSPTAGPAVETWMNNYGKARFGQLYDKNFKDLYTALRNTVYNSYIDHQNFGWQGNGKSSGYYEAGNINTTNDTFFEGFDSFFNESNINNLKQNKLPATLRADIIEFAAFYAAANVSKLCKRIVAAKNTGKIDEAKELIARLDKLMLNMDFLLTGHPLYDEAKWEEKARKLANGNTTAEKKYVKNARRIVSTWYGAHAGHEAVNDYASRIYAGIIRDYYLPRLRTEMTNMLGLTNKSLRTVELDFIPNGDNNTPAPALSAPRHYFAENGVETIVAEGMTDANTSDEVLLTMAKALVDQARQDGAFVVSKDPFMASTDTENHWYFIHSNNPNKLDYVLTATGDQSKPTAGFASQQLTGSDLQMWRFIQTGTDTYRMENRAGQNFAFDSETMKTYLANINCDVILQKDEQNNRYAIIPSSKKGVTHNSIHFNNNNVFTLWQATENGKYIDASTWTIEATDASAVPEDAEFLRFVRRLNGFLTTRHGQESLYGLPGQPRSAESLAIAIGTIDHRIDALTTYSEYLGIYRKAINDNFNMEGINDNMDAKKLFELILSTFQIDPAVNNVDAANDALHTALVEAQQTLADAPNKTASQLKSAFTKLQTAVKTYIDSCASFAYTSPAPSGEKFDAKSKVITMKFGNASFVTLDNQEGGYLKVNNSPTPNSNNHGYWVVCGNDREGYTFYNLAKGPSKILGITGTEAAARATLYDAKNIPTGVVTKFLFATNNNKQPVFYYTSGNERRAWNNRDGWFALWNGAGAFQGDLGSQIICTEVKNIDASEVEYEQDKAKDITEMTSGSWVPATWKTATSAQNKSNFYEAASLDITGVTVASRGNVAVTIKYTSGNHRQVLYGVELVNAQGEVAYHDYHSGSAGGQHTNNTYNLSSVEPGTYTARCWSGARSDNDYIDCSGTVTISGAASKSANYTKQTWVVDNSLLTDELKSSYTRVGTNNYKYMDVENVSVEGDGALGITYRYTSGSERLDIIGVELLDTKTGYLVETAGTFDGHYGFTGNSSSANTYGITVPKGNYTIRTWAMYTRPITSSGTIAYNFQASPTSVDRVTSMKDNNGKYYNLQGQRIQNPRKGQVVLHNGKKILM